MVQIIDFKVGPIKQMVVLSYTCSNYSLQHVDLCTTRTASHCQRRRLWAVFRGRTLTVVYRGGDVIEKLSICKQVKTKNAILSEEQRKNTHFSSTILSILTSSCIWILSILLIFVCFLYIP